MLKTKRNDKGPEQEITKTKKLQFLCVNLSLKSIKSLDTFCLPILFSIIRENIYTLFNLTVRLFYIKTLYSLLLLIHIL